MFSLLSKGQALFMIAAKIVDLSGFKTASEGAHALVRFYKTLPDALEKLRETARAAQIQLGGDMGVQEEMEKWV
eukprot:1142431-Pelagomonas_calceolata.AAC.2